MPYNKIKVVIVDDSAFFRAALRKALAQDSFIQVVAEAGDAKEAEKVIKETSPDVITLDVEMPGKRGTDFLKEIMKKNPVRVVLVSSLQINVFEALQNGAIDFVKKPDMTRPNEFASFSNELSVKIKIASTAKIHKEAVESSATASLKNLTSVSLNGVESNRLIAIGASTGGTEATLEILVNLPKNFPPVLVTQHMPVGFTKMYADRLDRICQIHVAEAENGMRVERGTCLIAPGDKHMRLRKDAKGYYVHCAEGEKVSGHCPSVDVLFESVAEVARNHAIGVILTGMGRDGAAGMLKMHNVGCYTIGQNKESCVVYGMPMEAHKLGAVDLEANIREIADILIRKLMRDK